MYSNNTLSNLSYITCFKRYSQIKRTLKIDPKRISNIKPQSPTRLPDRRGCNRQKKIGSSMSLSPRELCSPIPA